MRSKQLIIYCLLFISCNGPKKIIDCTGESQKLLGSVEILLPKCYNIYFYDSLNKNNFYLIVGDTIKLELSTNGLVSLDGFSEVSSGDSIIISNDTVSHYLRKIGFQRKKNGYSFFAGIIDLDKAKQTVFDLFIKDTSSNPLHDHRYYIKLLANSNPQVGMSKDEIDRLVRAFKNSKIIESD